MLGSLVGLILAAGIALYVIGTARMSKVYTIEPSNLTLPTDAESIEFGKHRVETFYVKVVTAPI